MEERVRYMLRRFLKTVTDYAICVYLVLILMVLPFYNRQGYAHIGTDKAYFFDKVIINMGKVIIPSAVLYLAVEAFHLRHELWNRLREKISVTDLFAAGYGVTVVISWLCSNYRADALWGAAGWFMGMWPQLALVLSYLLVSKLWKPRKWILYLAMTASWVVFLLGYLNRAGIDPLGMGFGNPSFISTIGNINWYCGYLVSVFFAGVVLLWKWETERLWQRLLLMGYVIVGFGSLVTQGSDSGLVTLAAAMLMLFVLSVSDSGRMLMFWQEMLLLGGACLVTYAVRGAVPGDINKSSGIAVILTTGWRPFFMTGVSVLALVYVYRNRKNGTYPEKSLRILAWIGVSVAVSVVVVFLAMAAINTLWPGSLGSLSENPLFTFSARWGSSRGATWWAGWRCFEEQDFLHKLVGVGPDAMSAFLYRDGSQDLQEMVRKSFGQLVLCNAHNEWLTVMVDTGVLGVVAFVGMMVTGIGRFLRDGRNKMTYACGFCLLAYTINNIFSFQQSVNTATVFAVFGIGGAFLEWEEHIE